MILTSMIHAKAKAVNNLSVCDMRYVGQCCTVFLCLCPFALCRRLKLTITRRFVFQSSLSHSVKNWYYLYSVKCLCRCTQNKLTDVSNARSVEFL